MLFGKRTVEFFEKDATQTLIMAMVSIKIVAAPIIYYLKNGDHLRDAYLNQLINDPGMSRICAGDQNPYFLILTYHALGAGVYMTVMSNEGHDISSIAAPSAMKILEDLRQIGSVELGLKSIRIDPESNNKKVVDHLVMSSVNAIVKEYRKEISSSQKELYTIALLNIYFNVGVTIAIARAGGHSGG